MFFREAPQEEGKEQEAAGVDNGGRHAGLYAHRFPA